MESLPGKMVTAASECWQDHPQLSLNCFHRYQKRFSVCVYHYLSECIFNPPPISLFFNLLSFYCTMHACVRSFEHFVDAVAAVNCGAARVEDFHHSLASIAATYRTTAILEAGRRSLDESRTVQIAYGDAKEPCRPTTLI